MFLRMGILCCAACNSEERVYVSWQRLRLILVCTKCVRDKMGVWKRSNKNGWQPFAIHTRRECTFRFDLSRYLFHTNSIAASKKYKVDTTTHTHTHFPKVLKQQKIHHLFGISFSLAWKKMEMFNIIKCILRAYGGVSVISRVKRLSYNKTTSIWLSYLSHFFQISGLKRGQNL